MVMVTCIRGARLRNNCLRNN